MREAVFSVLGQDLAGQTFLDGFGGAGVMGLEAWSRGASVTIVERDRRKAAAIGKRARELDAVIELFVGDLFKVAARLPRHDIGFFDPPYALDLSGSIDQLAQLADVLLIEASSRTSMPARTELTERTWDRRYGDSWLHRYEGASGR